MPSWPTQGLVTPAIPGQLAWPELGAIAFSGGYAVQIPDAPSNTIIMTSNASGRYLDIENRLYERTRYIGLRGYFSSNKPEDVRSARALRRYTIWRWIGYAPGPTADAADVLQMDELHTAFKNAEKQPPIEPGLTDKRNMYFFDGQSFDGLRNPKMTLYYQDGQGRKSEHEGEVGIDFYQMKHLGNAGTGKDVSPELLAASGSYSVNTHATDAGSAHQDKVRQARVQTSTVESAAGGPAATEIAYQSTYAEILAWNRLSGGSTNESHLEPLLSLYATMREQMMQTAGEVMGSHGMGVDPDKTQSHITSTIETRLRDQDFSDAWIDFFMTKENISTITPEGYDQRGGQLKALPAGTSGDSVQRSSDFSEGTHWAQDSNRVLATGTGGAFTRDNITVVGPVFHIKAPSAQDVAGYGPGGFTEAKLVQMRPNYNFSDYTLRTLGDALSVQAEFIFPYTPNDIQYQGLGAKWVEIPRTGDLPLLEFSQWTLMKVSMEFIIAHAGDGLRVSVYDQLEQLRRMAQMPFPVSVFGLDQLLRVSMKRAEVTGRPLEFVIGDLSISSIQRTVHSGDKEITSARVKLTLQEIPIEESTIHQFKRPIVVPVLNPPDGGEGGKDLELLTPVVEAGAVAAGGVTNEFGKVGPAVGAPPPWIFSVNPPATADPTLSYPDRQVLDYDPPAGDA